MNLLYYFLFLIPVSAEPVVNISQIGPHYPIFIFEKNENPENIMVVYSKLDENCQFQAEKAKPDAPESLLHYYWLMDGKNYKPVHPMILSGIEKRLEVKGSAHAFTVELTDLKEVKNDLPDALFKVKADKSGKTCQVQALITLGPSEKNRVLKVSRIKTESKKTFAPPFRKLESVTLIGTAQGSSEKIEHTYAATKN
jgi:hypothetical protein